MKIVMPMAGRGSRYSTQGYETPKPLIEVAGRPMFLWALEGLLELPCSELIIVALEDHAEAFDIAGQTLRFLAQHGKTDCSFQLVLIPEVTEGQLCTVLAARHLIDNDTPLLVAASDTFIESHLAEHIHEAPAECAGLISVVDLPGEQWSFARCDAAGRVVEVAEKKRISDHASNGLYYFSKGSDLVRYGQEMIARDERTRGEFYVIPVYQHMINDGKLILVAPAGAMWDLGTPEAKARFEAYLQTLHS